MTEMRLVTIYTDGGADPNPGPGGWGAVLIDAATGKAKEIWGSEPETTNNRMELTAAISALETLKVPCAVELYTDSTYVRRGITEWIPRWIEQDWTRKRGGKVKNVDLWRRLATATQVHTVAWHWVKGHSGDRYNERADELATQGIRAQAAGIEPPPIDGYRVYLMVSAKGGKGTWAAMIKQGDEEQISWQHEEGVTSNQLDLIAAIEALSPLPPGSQVTVYSLNDYLRNGATRWRKGWKRRGWRKKSGDPIANVELWMQLDEILQDLDVQWPPVKDEGLRMEFEDVGRQIEPVSY
ncbi:MAG: ribonuclease HI, partial [Chloroflexi bacterium]|nr:ribonuclease HI [Chloroflexota bacterium]